MRKASRLRASSAVAMRTCSSARLPLRDVPKNPLQTDHLALRIVERGLDDLHIDRVTAGRLILLDGFKGLALLHYLAIVALIFLGEIAGEEIKIGFAKYFRRPSAPGSGKNADSRR